MSSYSIKTLVPDKEEMNTETKPNNQRQPQFIALLLLTSCVVIAMSCLSREESDPFYLGGIQINEPDHDEWVSVLKDVGMNTVSVTVYARQGIWSSDNIWWDEKDEAVVSEIRTAKEEGMKVVLIPRVTLDHYFEENRFLWHGMTMPASDTLLTNWFKWYTVFVDKWAQVAEEEDVDVMAIGSELRMLSATMPVTAMPDLEAYYLSPEKQQEYISDRMHYSDQIPPEDLWVRGKTTNYKTLENYLEDEVATKSQWANIVACTAADDPLKAINERRAFILQKWYALIDKVRGSYSGKLTYAANFDNYHNVKFWDKLDMIGINAYFKLREFATTIDQDSLSSELESSWNQVFADIAEFRLAQALEQSVLFTELGYIYRENCTIMPWEGFGFSIAYADQRRDLLVWRNQKIDRTERKLAVEALHKVNQNHQLLSGILYWKLTTKDYHLPYEPFGLHLSREQEDPLQAALVRFAEGQ